MCAELNVFKHDDNNPTMKSSGKNIIYKKGVRIGYKIRNRLNFQFITEWNKGEEKA